MSEKVKIVTIWLFLPSSHVLIPLGRYTLGQETEYTIQHKLSCGSTFVQCVYLKSLHLSSLSQPSPIVIYLLTKTSGTSLEATVLMIHSGLFNIYTLSVQDLLLYTSNGPQMCFYIFPGPTKMYQTCILFIRMAVRILFHSMQHSTASSHLVSSLAGLSRKRL